MNGKKIVFLIADGMGDWPLAELGGKTPLQAAHTPHMDALAGQGMIGRCQTIPDGMAPGSDIANMALLGCDPATHHTGRGPIEAAAQGLQLDADDLVWRCNLVRVSDLSADGVMLDYSGGHIQTDQAAPLVRTLQECPGGPGADFYPGVQYRHLFVQRGKAGAVDAGLDIRPPHDILDQTLGPDLETYQRSPELWHVMRESARILAGDDLAGEVNAIWLWGQGRPLHLPNFQEHFGLSGAVVSAVDLVKGLGRALGMTVLDIPGATGYLDTDYAAKVAASLHFLEQGNFVFLHVEAPDECSHQGGLENKIKAIADFDAQVVGPVLAGLSGQAAAVLIACDHLTPLTLRTHVADAVPFLFWTSGLQGPFASHFSEASAGQSGLLVPRGEDLLPWVLRAAAGQ